MMLLKLNQHLLYNYFFTNDIELELTYHSNNKSFRIVFKAILTTFLNSLSVILVIEHVFNIHKYQQSPDRKLSFTIDF
jgi:hypothetical protein